MLVTPYLYLHYLLELLLHLLPYYDLNHFAHSWSFPYSVSKPAISFSQNITLHHFLSYNFRFLPLYHKTVMLTPILNILCEQFLNSVNLSFSAFSVSTFETAFTSMIVMLLYLCSDSSQYYSYTSPWVHLPSVILPPSPFHSTTMNLHYFSYHASHHTPHHMPLKTYSWNIPTNLEHQHQPIQLLFSNRLLIFKKIIPPTAIELTHHFSYFLFI